MASMSSALAPLFSVCSTGFLAGAGIGARAGKISYLVEDTYNFRPGHCYTYTMTINSSPEQIVVSIGGSIEGWD